MNKYFTSKPQGNMKDETSRNILLRFLNLSPENLVLAKQIHGNRVAAVNRADAGKFAESCDGLVTCDKSLILGIFTADCMPVLMSSKNGYVRAAVHAGWRGLADGIIENAVEIFKKDFNVLPEDIEVAVGPHIKQCCYEVNSDFEKIFNVALINNKFSLSQAAESKLKAVGVKDISVHCGCTFCGADNYFSYRKNKTEERQLSLVF
ncbi:peptidoglycan editing factor PgeF [Endomicrobium proavitum]|uniref:Purine nucleoside phosphorylase n=1 Tax=Endomicrobium proavitum TaxID=1408281 RepID=A0A0G3WK74_9BACT|nr:peptidoglycan editing factor PgeF [Endomicrobium proavitum]AKL98300.1 hypothetical protein Epro_0921 [Endomicrobium proavitum]